MFFDRFDPMVPGQTLENPKADYASAKKAGPCRVSEQALYMPDKRYFLRSSILDVIKGTGVAHVTGCCAGGIPLPRIVIVTDSMKFPFLCDNEKAAVSIVEALKKDIDSAE